MVKKVRDAIYPLPSPHERHFLDLVAACSQDEVMSRLGPIIGWMLPLALLVVAIVSVPLSILDDDGLPRYRALRSELADVERLNSRLGRDVQNLQREVRDLRTDPEAIERIARDELGMIRADELLFQFPQ